jgi:glc operon protein GlcG
MINKKSLELADVKSMATAAEAEARKHDSAFSIAICDEAGHLLWFQRMDGATLLSVTMCQAKARTAAISGRPSKTFQQAIDGGMHALASAEWMQGALEGGVPILVDGKVVGGIAASGGPGEIDAAVAAAGAAALRP